jgi:hypothetical protein
LINNIDKYYMGEQTDNIVEPLLWLSIIINVNNVMVIVFGGLFFGEIWTQISEMVSAPINHNTGVTLFINIVSLLLVVVPFGLALYAVISSDPDVLNIAYSVGVITCSIIALCVVGYNKNKTDKKAAAAAAATTAAAAAATTAVGGRRKKLRRIGR